MKKTTFNVILRLQDYYSDGLLEIIEKELGQPPIVVALFTNDPAIGCYEKGAMYLSMILRSETSNNCNYEFNIKMDEIYSPMVYYFSEDNYSLEFVSVENNKENIDYLEKHFLLK